MWKDWEARAKLQDMWVKAAPPWVNVWRQQIETTWISISMMMHQESVIFNSELSGALWCRGRCWKESNHESLVCGALLCTQCTQLQCLPLLLLPVPAGWTSHLHIWSSQRPNVPLHSSTHDSWIYSHANSQSLSVQGIRSQGYRKQWDFCPQTQSLNWEETHGHCL